jgi:hypothetical protein
MSLRVIISGWDKHSPEYEPDIGPGGRVLITLFVLALVVAAIGVVFA